MLITAKPLNSVRSTPRFAFFKTLAIGIVPLITVLSGDNSKAFAQDPNTRTFGGVTSATFSCIQQQHDPLGVTTTYEPHDVNQGTATSSLPWPIGKVATIGYYLDANNQQITYTIQELSPPASPDQVWSGIQNKINACQR